MNHATIPVAMASLVRVMVAAKVVAKVVVVVVQGLAVVNIPTATAAMTATVVRALAISRQVLSSMKAVHNSAKKTALVPVHLKPLNVQPMCAP
jgi:hypothetical protein